ncbi:hypothetical protein BDF19DRAFT_443005 [Syncephalis fuscata]|nr:hypothetical protein BDF19DRAFT_443005 [Syncephalis fuscata]
MWRALAIVADPTAVLTLKTCSAIILAIPSIRFLLYVHDSNTRWLCRPYAIKLLYALVCHKSTIIYNKSKV